MRHLSTCLLLAVFGCGLDTSLQVRPGVEWRPCSGLRAGDDGASDDGALLHDGARRAEQPHTAVGPRGEVAVAWGAVAQDGTADILLAWVAGAGRLSPPLRVNPAAGTAVAGRQVGPRVALTPAGRVVVGWVDRARDPAGDIVVAFSDDGAKSFSAPVRVNDDNGLAAQEYLDLAAQPDGSVALVWLDERDAPAGALNQKQVYFALSQDGARSFSRNERLTSSSAGVCPCCRPGLAASSVGSLHVVYRDRAGKDLLVRMRSREAGSLAFRPPVEVAPRRWEYQACPVDGPCVAAGEEGELLVAWMDAASGRETVWLARSGDGGRTFTGPVDLAAPPGASGAPPPLEAPSDCCDEPRGASPSASPRLSPGGEEARAPAGRPALVAGGKEGAFAAWEDGEGRVWMRAIGGWGGRLSLASPLVVAGGGDVGASSPALALADAIHVFWTEQASEGAEAGPLLAARLRHARLIQSEDGVRIPRVPAGGGD